VCGLRNQAKLDRSIEFSTLKNFKRFSFVLRRSFYYVVATLAVIGLGIVPAGEQKLFN
jgi:hypothetical protein